MKTVRDYIGEIKDIAACGVELDVIATELEKRFGDAIPKGTMDTIQKALRYLNSYRDALEMTEVKNR